MIYIAVFNTNSMHLNDALCREDVAEGESIYCAFQRMFTEGYIPNEGDIIRIVDTSEDEAADANERDPY